MAGEPGGDDDGTSCSRWSCDFAAAHAIFGTGFITAPVAVLHLVRRPHSGAATFFAAFAVFFAAVSLVLCCRFYAELKSPPWRPRWWLSASPAASSPRGDGDDEAATGTALSHDLRLSEQPPVITRVGIQATRSGYEHRDGAADCAVCLGEVENGEAVRRLPACKHAFHTECIDMWLRARATCPVCRRSVVLALERPPPEVVVDIGAVQAHPGPAMPTRPGMIVFASHAPGQIGIHSGFTPS